MPRKPAKPSKGAVGATPGEDPRPGQRTAPHPDPAPAPAPAKPRAITPPLEGSAAPTVALSLQVPSAMYERLRQYAADNVSAVEAEVLAAVQTYLARAGY